VAPFVKEKWEQWQAARAQEQDRLALVAIQQKCLTHAPPANQVVYTEDPEEAAKLLAGANGAYEPLMEGVADATAAWTQARARNSRADTATPPVVPPGFQPPVRAAHPDYYRQFENDPFFGGGAGGGQGLFSPGHGELVLLFLHERKTASGKAYLVDVRLYPGFTVSSNTSETDEGEDAVYQMAKSRGILARAWDSPAPPAQATVEHAWSIRVALPDAGARNIAQLPMVRVGPDGKRKPVAATRPAAPIDYGNRLRVFAGQPDPADGSHFTIAYELDGRKGTIDGWVRDTGIHLRPREGGPASDEVIQELFNVDPADAIWDPTAPPAAE
jgi:hypothetical protein